MFFLLCAWIKTVGKMASWYNMHVTQQTMERTHGLHMNIRDVRINSTSTFLSLHGSKVYSCLRHLLKTPLKSISKHPPPPQTILSHRSAVLLASTLILKLVWSWLQSRKCRECNLIWADMAQPLPETHSWISFTASSESFPAHKSASRPARPGLIFQLATCQRWTYWFWTCTHCLYLFQIISTRTVHIVQSSKF